MANILIIDNDPLLHNLPRCVLKAQSNRVYNAKDGEVGLRPLENAAVETVETWIGKPRG